MDTPINAQALPAGTRLEEFVIEGILGSGGFGVTYLARDTSLGRQVVIKENLPAQFCFRDPSSLTVAPRHTTGEDAENFRWSLENFSKEAAMLASLNHPGIVKVLRSFQGFGTAYLVMPFVEGMTLDEFMRLRQQDGQSFTEEELRGLLDRVLSALGYLHERGIYHRDIKPGNILITNEGVPVLIDFGSARQRLSERSMTVVESAGYTPFEQLQSRGNVGPWSDLYALGGTLVKAITGEAPPKANDRMRKDPYRLLTERPELGGQFTWGLLHGIDKSLEVDEENRWQHAGEWLAALQAEVPAEPPPRHEPPPLPKTPSRKVPPLPRALILGIDLGTTNSCISVWKNGKPVVVENSEGGRTTPSVVAFTKTGERIVGQVAKRQAITNPTNTIFAVKRLMGRTFDEVQNEKHRVPYKVVKAANGDAHIQVQVGGEPQTFSPPEISAMILAKLKSDAEAKLGETITQAVITVPAYFNIFQCDATRDAGRIAGLEVLSLIKETTAASLAYGLPMKRDQRIVVYDLGGGNFTTEVDEIGDGVFEVKATNGDTHLGGDDWDNAIMDWIFNEFKVDSGIDLTKQPDAVQRIKEEAEKAKIALSSSQEYEINLPFVTADQSGPKHIQKKLTRSKLEQLTDPLFERTIGPVKACLKDAGLAEKDINELVLVGGMTRMPRVIETARKLVGKEPHKGVNPDEVVAIGAAIHGGVLKGDVQDVLLLNVTPLTIAIETAGGVATPMIPRNTTIPTRKSQIFSTYSDDQPGIDIVVLQGERPLSRDNKNLGTFHLEGIPPAPRGTPQIEVNFDIDANGILHVSAKDLGTGKEQKISITGSSGLRPGFK